MAISDPQDAAPPAQADGVGAVVIDLASARARCADFAAERDAQLQMPTPAPADAPVDAVVNRSCEVSDGPQVDWDTQFGALTDRLRESADACLLPQQPASDSLARVAAKVLECADDLSHLRATMAQRVRRDLARDLAHKLALSEVQSSLTQARAELVAAQVGERVARHRALHDHLTALPNGSCFRERLSAALAACATQAPGAARNLAVFYIDLDGFKAINDVHGHEAGDELLRLVAARLSGALRAEDVVGRLGGDEFACVVCAQPAGRLPLTRLAANMFDAVWAPFQIGRLNLCVRPSIGIALSPTDGNTAELLLRHADAAMYRAKRQQSGHTFFNRRLDA